LYKYYLSNLELLRVIGAISYKKYKK